MEFDTIETIKVFTTNEDMVNEIDSKNIEKPIVVVYSNTEDKGCYVNLYKAYFIIGTSQIDGEQRIYTN